MRDQIHNDQGINQMWNVAIVPNATVNVGFTANRSATNNKPTSFTLNGTACTITP